MLTVKIFLSSFKRVSSWAVLPDGRIIVHELDFCLHGHILLKHGIVLNNIKHVPSECSE